jgi:Tol biopolymer transport system component/DNA-binding winged helix-turn-helix (wHTH) protein
MLSPDESRSKTTVRFGAFELNPETGELTKGGRLIRLAPQPFKLLSILVSQPGKLISREELRHQIWNGTTFVNFEQGLNFCVRKIRSVLDDDADQPHFIETVPRRGYRFVGAVRQMPDAVPLRLEAAPSRPQLPPPRRSQLPAGSLIVAGVAVLVLALFAVWRGAIRLPVVANVVKITNDQKTKAPKLPVTDGVRFFFVEGAPTTSGSTIAEISNAGGETTQIATPLSKILGIYAISPDGSELMVGNGANVRRDPVTGHWGSGAELWVQPLPAGTPWRVGNIYAFAACWTPDQSHILYADGYAIMIANKDGTESKELAPAPGMVQGLRFSPDGRRIRFYVTSRPELDLSTLWEMDASGKDPHLLLPDWKESPHQCCGNWSPDGKYYYFEAGQGADQAIWVLPERHNFLGRTEPKPFRLLSGPMRLSDPVPLNDGKRLLVMGEERRVELLRYDLQSGRFDSYFQGISAGTFDFSPDRKWIAYVAYPDMTLWRSRPDGSDKMQLTFSPVRAYGPSWSPDGSRIAFTDFRYYHPLRVGIVPSSGGTMQLIPPASANEVQADPTWTPDGKSIVFGRFSRSEPDQPVLPLQDPGRQEIDQLDLNTGRITVIPLSEGFFSPRLSPDGRYIAALSSGFTELMLFDTRTQNWSKLLQGNSLAFNFWSHDGKYVYFRDTSGSSAKLERVRIVDRVLEPVLSLKDLPQVVDGIANWFGLTPDGAPVVIRDRSVQEVYALDLR